MAKITEELLKAEVEDATITLNHNIVESVEAEEALNQLKEQIEATKGAIRAFKYLLQMETEVDEPETPKPDDSDAEGVGEEA